MLLAILPPAWVLLRLPEKAFLDLLTQCITPSPKALPTSPLQHSPLATLPFGFIQSNPQLESHSIHQFSFPIHVQSLSSLLINF